MPGNVQLAAAVEVLPIGLSAAFSEEYAWPIVQSGPYADSASQRRYDGTTGRKAWGVSKRMAFDEWNDLVDFAELRKGSTEAFFFYPNADDHDATGEAMTGRYRVRFEAGLSRSMALSRSSVEFRLIQVE